MAGTLCMACCSYAFIQLIYTSPPRAFILLNSLAFRIVIVCRCAHDQQTGSATLTNVSSSVTPTISNESMPLGAHAMLESPSVPASQAPWSLCGLHVDSIPGSNSFSSLS